MNATLRCAAACLAIAVLGACGTPRLLMRDAPERAIPAPVDGRARVVLVAPAAMRDVISIVDERGQYLGQLGGQTYFSVSVQPGNRRFYALVDAQSYVVGGTVEAGRTYWITAERSFSRPLRWLAWVPGCDEDPMARLAGVRATEPDPQADPGGELARQLGNVPQRILEADEELAAMPEEDRAARTLRVAECASGSETP